MAQKRGWNERRARGLFAGVALMVGLGCGGGETAGPPGPPGTSGAPGPEGPPGAPGAPGEGTDGGVDAGLAPVTTVGQLTVELSSAQVVVDVTAYSLGVDVSESSVVSVRPLVVQARAGAATSPLVSALLSGAVGLEARLSSSPPGGGTPVPFATLGNVRVLSHAGSTLGSDGVTALESFELTGTTLEMVSGSSKAQFDVSSMTGTCADTCSCGGAVDPAEVGPYAYAPDPSLPIPAGRTRVDTMNVSVHTEVSAKLEAFEVGGAFDRSGVCAFRRATLGLVASSVTVDVMSPLSASFGAKSASTWSACAATIASVEYRSSPDGPRQDLSLRATGVLRTERTFDPNSGDLTNETTVGWSFLGNSPIAACP